MKRYFQIPFENVPEHPDYDVWYAGWDRAPPANLAPGRQPLVIGHTSGSLPQCAQPLITKEKTHDPPPPPLPGGLAEYKEKLPSYLADVMEEGPYPCTWFSIPFDRLAELPKGCTAFYATWTKDRPKKVPPLGKWPQWVIGAATADQWPPAARALTDKFIHNPPAPPPPDGGSEDYQAAFARWITSLPGA